GHDSSTLLSEDQFLCSICLDVLTDPVSTPCGHNFCKTCLTQYWDSTQRCHCPFCKEIFTRRPELKINTTLREVVDHFKKKSALDKPEVLCDACTGVKQKALKSCLDCRVTFCKIHLEPHNNVPVLKEHKLINPVENLEDYTCQKHKRPLELFCRDDQMCVCLFCSVTDHKTHNTVPIEEESGEKKAQLVKTQTEVQQMIQDRLRTIKEIKHSVDLRKRNTEKEKADSVGVFTALIRSTERSQAELLEVMEEKQKAAERQAEGLIKGLEQEITELQRRDTELEQISHTEDHLHFLQVYPSLCRPPHTSNWTDTSIDPHLSVETVRNTLSHLQKSLNEELSKTLKGMLREADSKELMKMQQYAVDVTLDVYTANHYLLLSANGKQVTHGDTEQKLPDTPKRFDYYVSVLGNQGFSSGRFYYEVQVSGKTDWDLGVARESVNRKRIVLLNPQNGFWTVTLRNGDTYKAHAAPPVPLSLREKVQKVGVFVDYEEGLVSFYGVESKSHIYSFTGQSFTEKLYPYFSPRFNNGRKNSAPLIISPVFKMGVIRQGDRDFAKEYGFSHCTSSPRFAQANREAERAVATIKGLWTGGEEKLKALMTYRATPPECGYYPAQLLMGRQLRTTIPQLPKNLHLRWPNIQGLRKAEMQARENQQCNYNLRHRAQHLQPLQAGQKVWLAKESFNRQHLDLSLLTQMKVSLEETAHSLMIDQPQQPTPPAAPDTPCEPVDFFTSSCLPIADSVFPAWCRSTIRFLVSSDSSFVFTIVEFGVLKRVKEEEGNSRIFITTKSWQKMDRVDKAARMSRTLKPQLNTGFIFYNLSNTGGHDSSSLLSEDQFLCSICLDVLTDPVSTPCGHNFCKTCLTQYWNSIEHCHCPFCKEIFTKRPELKINTTLREVVDQFKKKRGLDKPEVLCDACTGMALKSCLDCGVTYCKSHLEPHNKVPRLKEHKLIDPMKNLEDYICQKHNRPLELYCKEDQTCVCLFCSETDHKTHSTVPIEEESGERKTQLVKTQTEVQQMIQERLNKIKDIKHSVELRKRNTEKEKADSVGVFTALIRSIERCQAELLEVMAEKQKAAEKQAEDLIKDLEQEITELKSRDTELEQISHTEDHLHLLQVYPSLCRPPHTNNWTDIGIDPHLSVETVRNALSQLQKSLNEQLTKTLNEKIREAVSTELRRIQQYAVDVTLDADTASPNLILSNDGKQVTHGDTKQNLPANPNRFNECVNVLGKEGFSSGRFYYEVQVSGKTKWDLGVAKESINRKGRITLKPQEGFWTVILRNGNEYKACADRSVVLSLREKPQKVGVFVDYEEGMVSFYDVESRSHIYSFTGQFFTEKLYPFFSPGNNDGVGRDFSSLVSEDQFLCSICLDMLSDPVSTPCGHNFCKTCLTQYWDSTQHCHCPFCKEIFTKRPELKINTTLREVVDHYKKKSGLDKSEILCDVCSGVKQKALKSCLDSRVTF
ncbi:hypothetical protein NFI96_020247, partial [Prochilodus magdalenae]